MLDGCRVYSTKYRHEKVFVGHRRCAYAVGDSAIRTAVRSTGDPGECGSDDKGSGQVVDENTGDGIPLATIV